MPFAQRELTFVGATLRVDDRLRDGTIERDRAGDAEHGQRPAGELRRPAVARHIDFSASASRRQPRSTTPSGSGRTAAGVRTR